MSEYERLRLVGEFVRRGLRKEAAGILLRVARPTASGATLAHQKKRRVRTRRKVEATRPYFDVETGRFL